MVIFVFMQAVVDIEFEELLKVIKKLSKSKRSKLRLALDHDLNKKNKTQSLESMLLEGPTFSKEQLTKVAKARKAINQWRTK